MHECMCGRIKGPLFTDRLHNKLILLRCYVCHGVVAKWSDEKIYTNNQYTEHDLKELS